MGAVRYVINTWMTLNISFTSVEIFAISGVEFNFTRVPFHLELLVCLCQNYVVRINLFYAFMMFVYRLVNFPYLY